MSQNDIFPLQIQMFGRFSVHNAFGTEIRIQSAKNRALIALLAADEHFERKRCWLAQTLWPRQCASQSQTNLRQAIAKLRIQMGQGQDCLIVTRNALALDREKVDITPQSNENSVFLEDVILLNSNFDDWLAAERSKRGSVTATVPVKTHSSSPPTEQITLRIYPESAQRTGHRVLEDAVIDSVSQLIKERSAIVIVDGTKSIGGPANDTLDLSLRASQPRNGKLALSATLHKASTGERVWADSSEGKMTQGPVSHNVQCMSLSHRIADTIIGTILNASAHGSVRPETRGALLNTAIGTIFQMTPNGFDEAERMLNSMEPDGEIHAWLAQLCVIRLIERVAGTSDAQSLLEQAELHCAKAMALAPFHSDVLAAVSNARLVFNQDMIASREISDMAVRINKANPLAWWARSNALLYTGDNESAYISAVYAQKLSDRTGLKFWGDIQRALGAAATGRMQEAQTYAEASHVFNPGFRPPLRYLLGLHSLAGNQEHATRAAKILSRVEEDFSMERFLKDMDYPISMMRSRALLDTNLLSELET